jgi:Tol biopolymer transport system component
VDREGEVEPLSTQKKPYFAPRLSPDGNRVVYTTLGIERDLGIYDIDRDIASEIMADRSASWPIFSPSGNEIVYSGYGSSAYTDIFIKSLKEESEIKPLITSQNDKYASSLSSDGNLLAYLEDRNNHTDIFVYNFSDQSSTPIATSEYSERYPDFSPDSRWIAYGVLKDGVTNVFVRSSSGSGAEIQVSRDGGHSPLWARNGKQLFYLSNGFRQVWVCDVIDIKIPSFGSPRLLFEKDNNYLFGSIPIRGYDISLDDERFLTVQTQEQPPKSATEMILIQNWFEELTRLAPTKK